TGGPRSMVPSRGRAGPPAAPVITRRTRQSLLVGTVLCLVGCAGQPRSPEPADAPAVQTAATDMATTIRARIDEGDALGMPLPASERSDVRELYGLTSDAPLWIDASGRPSPAAREALTFLRESSNDGLEPARYHVDLLDRTSGDLLSASTTQASVAAAFDVMLSASTLQYFRHLHLGRVDPRSMGYRLNARREDHDFVAFLRSAIARREFGVAASTLAPALIQYRALRGALGRYRVLAADSSVTIAPPAAGTVHQGD